MIFMWAALLSCSRERSADSARIYESQVRLYFVDSFHIDDSTAALAAVVRYHFVEEAGFITNGSYEISTESVIGEVHEVSLENIPSGNCGIRYSVERPFVILGRKDNTGDARFEDTTTISVPANYHISAPPVDIWAFRLNRLVIYFDSNISEPQADSIIGSLGAVVLERGRSYYNGALLYRISTEEIGPAQDVKPLLESMPGIGNVFFDIYGQTYF
jgi:hypothetical protein